MNRSYLQFIVVMSLEVNNNMLPCRSRDDDQRITFKKSDDDVSDDGKGRHNVLTKLPGFTRLYLCVRALALVRHNSLFETLRINSNSFSHSSAAPRLLQGRYGNEVNIWRHKNKLTVAFDRFLFSEAWFADCLHVIKTNLHKMARSRLVKLSLENGQNQWCAAISNVRSTRIKKILNY